MTREGDTIKFRIRDPVLDKLAYLLKEPTEIEVSARNIEYHIINDYIEGAINKLAGVTDRIERALVELLKDKIKPQK